MRNLFAILLLLSTVPILAEEVSADSGWSPVIIARGAYRTQIKSLPLEMRPNRPLHFYGNAVRRGYYRSPSVPFEMRRWQQQPYRPPLQFLGN